MVDGSSGGGVKVNSKQMKSDKSVKLVKAVMMWLE